MEPNATTHMNIKTKHLYVMKDEMYGVDITETIYILTKFLMEGNTSQHQVCSLQGQ